VNTHTQFDSSHGNDYVPENKDSSTGPPPFALAAGSYLFPGPESTWMLVTPDGDWLRVDAPANRLKALATLLTRDSETAHQQLRAAREGGFIEEFTAFVEHGFLEARTWTSDPEIPKTSCALVGPGPTAVRLEAVLAPWFEVQTCEPSSAPRCEPPQITVIISDWEDEDRFGRIDEHVTRNGKHWYPVYRDGAFLCLGPLFGPRQPCRYDDLNRRLLACASQPAALRALRSWQSSDCPRAPQPSPERIDQAAATILRDLLRVFFHRSAPPDQTAGFSVQQLLDTRNGQLQPHVILPIPSGAAS